MYLARATAASGATSSSLAWMTPRLEAYWCMRRSAAEPRRAGIAAPTPRATTASGTATRIAGSWRSPAVHGGQRGREGRQRHETANRRRTVQAAACRAAEASCETHNSLMHKSQSGHIAAAERQQPRHSTLMASPCCTRIIGSVVSRCTRRPPLLCREPCAACQ